MALSIVQTIAAFPTAAPATASSMTIGPYNQAAGHFMAVATRNGSSVSVSSVSDTAGNLWHSKTVVGNTVKMQWWYVFNCLGSATNTITVNIGATVNSPNAVLYDVSGAITAVDPTDVSTGISIGAATSVTSPAYTSTVATELLLAIACNNTQSTNSWTVNGTSGIWTLDGPWPAGSTLPQANIAAGHQFNSSIQTSQTVTIGNGASASVWTIAVLGVTGPAPAIVGGNFLLLDVE